MYFAVIVVLFGWAELSLACCLVIRGSIVDFFSLVLRYFSGVV